MVSRPFVRIHMSWSYGRLSLAPHHPTLDASLLPHPHKCCRFTALHKMNTCQGLHLVRRSTIVHEFYSTTLSTVSILSPGQTNPRPATSTNYHCFRTLPPPSSATPIFPGPPQVRVVGGVNPKVDLHKKKWEGISLLFDNTFSLSIFCPAKYVTLHLYLATS